jgi:hypothetical protein
MVTIRLKGEVTADGQLRFDPPKNLPQGDVEITIEIPDPEATFSEAEIADLLDFTPKSGQEVVASGLTGGWEDKGIDDPVAWFDEQRRKQQERNRW